ncbi:MAG: type III-A CRISPR-associated protein Cas10/Csm1 [Bacteroidales bacterium]|nr:type III-A CRISPR-associated protein Cas10/Csm1 [Bacteroidales bacterium]MCM1147748.1 type III-A CRISPR-associated protein Cas10/Csm1 [Bacteroidales bacterium]MCM1206642.1 type III-A CRISPR-associated protein Cas10/Csm1 [Bacillota bacterium]MCM1510617.1 type III-A CRISPR-associated protein Cas10/Csm1 [Clostridium sp.]
MPADNLTVFSENLLTLLCKYTSNIPVGLEGYNDVSVYDFLKSSAALTVCLYDAIESRESSNSPFLLIGADLSGIQPYLYQVASKYASKNLKGRSFYLRILSDAVLRYIRKELGLPQANVIYNSGGGFYLLAPNTEHTKKRLDIAVNNIEEKLFDTHKLSLFLAIDFAELPKEALLHTGQTSLGDVWGQLFLKKDAKKGSKFKNVIAKEYHSLFNPFMTAGNGMTDICTGETFSNTEQICNTKGLSPIREMTKQQIELGQMLKNLGVMVIAENEIQAWNSECHLEPLNLGLYYYFIKQEKLKQDIAIIKDKTVTVVSFNDNTDMVRSKMCSIINKLDYYGGTNIKCDVFEELCKNTSAESFHRLGVLRMDVDNLGAIFQKGISPERSILPRMSALSRAFDYFFSGYLNTIWKEIDPDHAYIIYSGGDDLFIVGDWSVMTDMAERIHKDFKHFTCENPAFSISGGISFIDDKFPIIKGAEMSAQEEANAKSHVCSGKSKGSISFLGMAMNFEEEYPYVKSLKDAISYAINTDGMPKSFISKVLTHWMNADIKEHCIQNIKTYWMLTYDLSRMKERMKKSAAMSLIDNCKSEVCSGCNKLNGKNISSSYHPLELWAMACRWAELEIRSNKLNTN